MGLGVNLPHECFLKRKKKNTMCAAFCILSSIWMNITGYVTSAGIDLVSTSESYGRVSCEVMLTTLSYSCPSFQNLLRSISLITLSRYWPYWFLSMGSAASRSFSSDIHPLR